MGSKKGLVVAALAALLMIVPASASAAPEFSANVTSVEFVSPHDPSGAFDPFDSETYEASITITNTGDVNITSVEPSFASTPVPNPFRAPDPFSVSGGNCEIYNPGVGLESHFQIQTSEGGSCQFKVQFRPYVLAEGEYTETLKLMAFGMLEQVEGNTVEIPLSANVANNSDASVSPSSLDWGLVPADTTSTKTVTLNSTGTSRLLLSHSEITLPDGSTSFTPAFSYSQPDECLQIDAGESCDIEVSFTPPNFLTYESVLSLYGNFGTIKVPLIGSGSDPQVEVTPYIRFGEKIIGSRSTGTASLTSGSITPIDVDSAAISGPAASSYSLDYDAGNCQNLGFQGRCDFDVTFKPTTKGSHKADLVVTGTFGSKTIKLSGSAREKTPAELAVRVFGPRRAAPGSTVTLKAKIYNRGEITAKGVTLKTVLPKSLAAKAKPIRIKSIAAGKPVTKKIRSRVKPGTAAGSRIKVRFTVSAKSAKTGSSFRSIRIR